MSKFQISVTPGDLAKRASSLGYSVLSLKQQGRLLGFNDPDSVGKPYTGDIGLVFNAISRFMAHSRNPKP